MIGSLRGLHSRRNSDQLSDSERHIILLRRRRLYVRRADFIALSTELMPACIAYYLSTDVDLISARVSTPLVKIA